MRARAVRLVITTLLLASLLVTAFFLWNLEQRVGRNVALAGDAFAKIARLNDIVAGIGTAQQGYVAPGQLDEPWFDRSSTLTTELTRELEQARESLQSPDAATTLQQLHASAAALITADARIRENLQIGQELMASDVIFSDGRNVLDSMIVSVRELQAAEHSHLRSELAALGRQRWGTLGAVTLWWTALLLILAATSWRSEPAGESAAHVAAPQPPAAQPGVDRTTTVDLAAAAAVCTDLSRITATSALPGLLGRAAAVLDATGVILWISAGEQLFPVMAHGYSDETLTRLGPLSRDAANAAANAWRTGQLTVVQPSGGKNRGAIVTPLFGLHSCIGVLAAELRQGEENPTVQAVAVMIAAQLSTVVPAWPAGSLAPADRAPASDARSA
jgi:CHASE3 domain sensor protein